MSPIRVGLAQTNPTVGAFERNLRLIGGFLDKASKLGVQILVFPELALSGYPPEDLLLKDHFLARSQEALSELVPKTDDMVVVIGCPLERNGVRNAAVIAHHGRVIREYFKRHLPNYGVFDEKRYFEPGEEDPVFVLGTAAFGVSICEDIWVKGGPPLKQAEAGARLLINLSGSPFHAGKTREREEVLSQVATVTGAHVAYCNLVGGQDELVFDGRSMVIDPSGSVVARAKAFEEDLLVFDVPGVSAAVKSPRKSPFIDLGQVNPLASHVPVEPRMEPVLGRDEEVYRALVLGVGDYTKKNNFDGALLGLSGGIDSSLTAVIACDALGPRNVLGVSMPSEITSEASVTDAVLLASNLGIELMEISVSSIMQAFLEELKAPFEGLARDVTEENLQARIRGSLLMALSNKYGRLLLSTGNKSEMSVGYATLYGDMAGGLAVLKDVPKTLVYRLSRYRNSLGDGAVIPENVISKEPSAELSPGQKDTDSLPPYEILDPVLNLYIEQDNSVEEIVGAGFDRAVVLAVAGKVDRNEYKRRQSPPGIKITPRAFGRDRRMPMTNGYFSE
jgi:NAD+ synthase (glutamine-hydrolysing)